jgi:hypothetical protein
VALIFNILYSANCHVSTSEVDTWQTFSFLMENLTKVLIWSFSKIEVLSVMRIETQGLKNKLVKIQGSNVYLTQKRQIYIFFLKKKK